MSKNKLLLLLALLLTAATGAWAQEQVVYTLDGTQTTSNTNYATAGVVEQGSITWMVTGNTNMNPWRIGGKSLSGVDRSVWSENWLDETVTKVTLEFGAANGITVNSITMTVASDADFNNVIDSKAVTFSANNTVDVTPTEGKEWKDAYYRFVFNVTVSGSTNRFVQLKSIKFYNDPDAQQQGGGSTEPVAGTYTVSLKAGTVDADKWTVKVGEGQAQALPIDGLKGDGSETVTLQYTGRLKVKGVKATSDAAAAAVSYDQTVCINDGAVTVTAGEHWLITGTGEATSNKITISDGATATLDGVNISGISYCIKCLGDATIILKDGSENTLTSTDEEYPALSIGDAGTTLTIQGSTGVLNVTSGQYCAGIGGGYKNTNNTCGNIRIEGGVITAQGDYNGAGIGTDAGTATCGDIIITGGTITAKGGDGAAGIGTGYGGGTSPAVCGDITIANTVTKVTATKGANAPYSIGKGDGIKATCGTVTIGGTKYWENNAAVNGGDTYLATSPLIYDAAAAEATPALSITSPSVGQVIGSDGKNYAYGSLPTGVTAVAKICYVSGSNGLALALADEGYMKWSPAQTTCAAHTAPFTGGTWKLATKDEWDNMMSAAGSYSALRDGFSSVGGTNMQSDFYYWSSTEDDSSFAWYYDDYDQEDWDKGVKEYELYVRACLAF